MAFFFQSIGTPAAVKTALAAMTAGDPANTAEVNMVARVITFVTTEINNMATNAPQLQIVVEGNHSPSTAQLNMIIDLATPVQNSQVVHTGPSPAQS